MRDRNIVGELEGEDMTQAKIMQVIAGGSSKWLRVGRNL